MNCNFPRSFKLRQAFAMIEAGRKSVQASLKIHHSATKRELGDLLREAIRPITQTVRDPKLTARTGKIEIKVYAADEKFDMCSFWPKADYLRSIVLDMVGLKHAEITIRYVRNRRSTRVDVDFSWREVLWAGSTEGLLF